MICPPCGRAADQRAPRNQHCDDPGCTCGHQVQRYGTTTGGVQAPELTVVYASPPMLYTACDEGRHIAHPRETCEEYEAYRTTVRQWWANTMAKIPAVELMQMSDVPAALRGASGPVRGQDIEPLRKLAAQALGEQPGTVHLDPRANDPAYHPITGYRTWAEVEADPPQFTGLHATLPVETACTATLTSPFGAGTYRCAQPAGHYDDTAEPTFGADGWATDIGGWHAMAGARRCVWADTADGATPHVDTTTED